MMVVITRLRLLIAGCSSDTILRGYLARKMNQTARFMLNKGMWACAGAAIKYWTPCIMGITSMTPRVQVSGPGMRNRIQICPILGGSSPLHREWLNGQHY